MVFRMSGWAIRLMRMHSISPIYVFSRLKTVSRILFWTNCFYNKRVEITKTSMARVPIGRMPRIWTVLRQRSHFIVKLNATTLTIQDFWFIPYDLRNLYGATLESWALALPVGMWSLTIFRMGILMANLRRTYRDQFNENVVLGCMEIVRFTVGTYVNIIND